MEQEHQQNKTNKGHSEKTEFDERGLRREGTVLNNKHIRENIPTQYKPVNKRHLHSTTTIQLHLTIADSTSESSRLYI